MGKKCLSGKNQRSQTRVKKKRDPFIVFCSGGGGKKRGEGLPAHQIRSEGLQGGRKGKKRECSAVSDPGGAPHTSINFPKGKGETEEERKEKELNAVRRNSRKKEAG